MSLFKTEQFWTTSSGQGDSYTSSSLCVANFLSNSNNAFDQIITGSLNGYLRLFSPQKDLDNKTNSESDNNNNDNDNPFSLSKTSSDNKTSSIDIAIEHNLSQPIIQIESGRFSNDSKLSLAVLNPNRLLIFEIDEESMTFKTIEEFSLKRVAFNFCFGNFGRVSERDFICVQSTDTTLSFFTNGHLSFSCFLSDYLLPGPIQYLSLDDSILIVNSNRFLESYKYKNLAVLNASKHNSSLSLSESGGKSASPDWRFNLGEDALQIEINTSNDNNNNQCTILIVSRFSVFIFDYQNRTSLKKRFECRLKRAICYNSQSPSENAIGPRFITINGLNELSVFHNTALKWKASIDNTPDVCDLKIGRFNGLNGFIVVLSESGRLSVVFLGTDPTLVSPAVRESTLIHSDRNEEVLSILKQKIRSITAQNSQPTIALSNSTINKANKSPLKISIDYSSAKLSSDYSEYSIDIRLKSVSSDLTNILTRIAVEKPIECRRNYFSNHSSISPGKDALISLKFVRTAAMVVSSLKASIFVSFDSSNSIESHCRITQTSLSLPIALVLSICPPEKNAKFKLTIDTPDHPVVDLSQLFSDLSSVSSVFSDEKFAPVAIGFRYHNDGPIVTILASGATKRYRIQSDHFEAIWLVLHELTNRLNRSLPNLSIRYSDPFPIDSYFLVLDCHFAIRSNLRQLEQLLNDRSRQYRAIQKLFLTKIKDQSIAPPQSSSSSAGGNNLDNLESLLENSISQLTQLADILLEQQNHLAIVSNALCAATNTIGYLIGVSTVTNITAPHQRDLLSHALSQHHCRDYAELGLEELYEQIFSFLLKQFSSASSNFSRRAEKKLAESKFELPNNIDRLKKHIRLFCEIITTGSKTGAVQSSVISESINEDNIIDDDESDLKKFVTSPRSNKPKKSKRTKKLIME